MSFWGGVTPPEPMASKPQEWYLTVGDRLVIDVDTACKVSVTTEALVEASPEMKVFKDTIDGLRKERDTYKTEAAHWKARFRALEEEQNSRGWLDYIEAAQGGTRECICCFDCPRHRNRNKL